jgi:hypothetical protein
VLLADHRAADRVPFQAGGLDEPPGEVARWVTEDRPRVGLRKRLLLDPLVRDLLDPLHRVRTIAGPAAEPRAEANDRRSLKRARPVRVPKLVHGRGPRVPVHVDELGIDQNIGRLAAEGAGVAVDGAADGTGNGRHPLESFDARARRDSGDVCELGARRGGHDLAVDL